ncbi:hypothetical protein QQP08_026599 [Theobroma cacao]|nr:hypothetical protein QQP08_026599 [Theobroma cacao]
MELSHTIFHVPFDIEFLHRLHCPICYKYHRFWSDQNSIPKLKDWLDFLDCRLGRQDFDICLQVTRKARLSQGAYDQSPANLLFLVSAGSWQLADNLVLFNSKRFSTLHGP